MDDRRFFITLVSKLSGCVRVEEPPNVPSCFAILDPVGDESSKRISIGVGEFVIDADGTQALVDKFFPRVDESHDFIECEHVLVDWSLDVGGMRNDGVGGIAFPGRSASGDADQ
jgi:hypothetical protein